MFKITSDARIWFQITSWATMPVVGRTHHWVRANVDDVMIVWRNTHNNMKPNANWFPATLTDTDVNIYGIQVKSQTHGIYNIPSQRVDYGEQCHVPVYMQRNIRQESQGNDQELHPQARFFKGLILTLISTHIHYKVWDEITSPFPNSMVQPLKFGNGQVISSHTLWYM